MSKRFMSGTKLYVYECMMQSPPNAGQWDKYAKRAKRKYIGLLERYMRENGYGEICGRVLKAVDCLIIDEIAFLNAEHRDTFWLMYSKCYKERDEKLAVIYLLSSKKAFKNILSNYADDPMFVMPDILKNCREEEVYDIYQAAKMTAGIKTGLYEEDLFEEELIDDKILCLIMTSKLIESCGVCCQENQNRKPQHINNKSMNYRKRQNTYIYNGQKIRIK